MKNKGLLFLIVIAVVLAAFCTVLISKYVEAEKKRVSQKEVQVTQTIETERVLVTNTEIQMGQPVGQLQVRAVDMPKALIPEGAVQSLEVLEGRVASFNIPKGDILMMQKVVLPSQLPRASLIIEEGQRLVSVRVDEIKASGFLIKNGDFVDIVGTFPIPEFMNAEDVPPTISVTFLQKVKIFDIVHGQEQAAERAPADDPNSGRLARGVTATFVVSPREAEIILAAEDFSSNLALVLRPLEDEGKVDQPSELHGNMIRALMGETAEKRKAVIPDAPPPAPAPPRRSVM